MVAYREEQLTILEGLEPIERAAHALRDASVAVQAAEDRVRGELKDLAPETRTADSALRALDQVRLARVALRVATDALVKDARARGGTWRKIGDSLGVTPQAVHERYGESADLARTRSVD